MIHVTGIDADKQARGQVIMNIVPRVALIYGLISIGLLVSAIFEPVKLGKLIIDTDAGGDDAAAIFLALAAQEQLNSEGFEVVAITCTYGNTELKNVEKNVLKILTIANRSDIPVYVGARKPLLKNISLDYYFGEDGFGDFDFDEEIMGQIDRSKHASLAMADLARANPGEVSVMIIGPMTNIALATTLDRDFVKNVQRFFIMGSSVHGLGNVAPNAEFNFYQDPHSDFIVLTEMPEEAVLLFPWETATRAAIPVDWRKKVLGTLDSRTIGYLNKIEKKTIAKASFWTVADLMLCALAIWPELISRSLVTNLTPVFDGAAEGTALVDYNNKTGKPRNVEILENFDVEAFKQLLLDMFSH